VLLVLAGRQMVLPDRTGPRSRSAWLVDGDARFSAVSGESSTRVVKRRVKHARFAVWVRFEVTLRGMAPTCRSAET
jgi:hypothetical protein